MSNTVEPELLAAELPCVHRGELLRTAECELCGGRRQGVEVFQCQVHTECTLRRIRSGSQGPASCLTCRDRLTPAGERPTHAPRRLILRTGLCPGDVLTLTAAIESLHRKYRRQFLTDVRTPCPAVWENNPHITPLNEEEPGVEVIDCHYPAIDRSNQTPDCFLSGYAQHLARVLGKPLPLATNRPHLYLSTEEQSWMGQVEEQLGRRTPYWLVNAGTKRDFTAKQWPLEFYQAVVDHFAGRMLFVQVGSDQDLHPLLRGVLNLVGQTDHRQLIRLAYHAAGGLGPVTYLQHLCAAWQKPYVCLLGGREPVTWAQNYPQQVTLHTVGQLDCCRTEACWRSRVVPLGDGDGKDRSLCQRPVITLQVPVPQCLALIRPGEVVAVLERMMFDTNA